MTDAWPGLTSSQRGKIAESFVATALMLGSGGRLSPFVPVSDDHGIDLIARDKETGRCLAIQVKSWFGTASGTAQFDVRKATYQPLGEAAVIAIVLDPIALAMTTAWLIPMSEVPSVATEGAEKYALTPSISSRSSDRYRRYRKTDIASLAASVSKALAPPD